MVGIALVVLLPIVLLAVARAALPEPERARVIPLLLVGYGTRIIVSFFLRDLPLFSHGAGVGDFMGYEDAATVVSKMWEFEHPFYVTSAQYPPLMQTTLPANLFGMIFYLNGGVTEIGCTAVIATLACLTCLNLCRLGIDLGIGADVRFAMTAVVLFLPSFLFYTSDMFKDGLVAFWVIGVLGASLRFARRSSPIQLAVAAVCLLGLWLTRFYLVYAVMAPLALGIIGFQSRSWLRQAVALLLVGLAMAIAVYYLRYVTEFQGTATEAFAKVHTTYYEAGITAGGSGVEIDGSSPTASLALKVLYTVFAPFPWQSGSIGLQLAKVECLLWYFVLYRACRGAVRLWHRNRSDLVVMVSFIVPTTLAYAASFGNVGLIVRERIPVVMAVMLLAGVSWPEKRPAIEGGVRVRPSAA